MSGLRQSRTPKKFSLVWPMSAETLQSSAPRGWPRAARFALSIFVARGSLGTAIDTRQFSCGEMLRSTNAARRLSHERRVGCVCGALGSTASFAR